MTRVGRRAHLRKRGPTWGIGYARSREHRRARSRGPCDLGSRGDRDLRRSPPGDRRSARRARRDRSADRGRRRRSRGARAPRRADRAMVRRRPAAWHRALRLHRRRRLGHWPALAGRRILSAWAHPRVERLRITGYDAIDLTSAEVWPSLRELDFAFQCQYSTDHRDPGFTAISQLLRTETIPALTTLDVSRNERGHLEPRSLGGGVVISAFFTRFANHPNLATARLPSLPHETAVDAVERTLATLPAVRDVAVFAPSKRLPVHPTATIREIPIVEAPPGPLRLA